MIIRLFSMWLLVSVSVLPAFADNPQKGTFIYDAAFTSGQFSSARTMDNVRFKFSKVSIDSEGRAVVSDVRKTGSSQYFARPAKLAIYEKLRVEAGKYVLSSITFNFEGRVRAYCFPFETILFDVPAGKSSYIGQLHMQAPSTSTHGVESFVVLNGMARNLDASKRNKYWRFKNAIL